MTNEIIFKRNYQVMNPDYKSRLKKALERQFFMKLIGFDITRIEPGFIEGELNIEEKHMQQHDFLHGGLMASCLDIAMGFSAFTLLPPDKAVVTADINISYYNPGDGVKLIARGWVDKPGSRLYFCEGEISVIDKNGKKVLTNKAKSIMCVIDVPPVKL
jgi:uncharacterized protein (TIGR00369 family)